MDGLALLTDGMVTTISAGDSQIFVTDKIVGVMIDEEELTGVILDE